MKTDQGVEALRRPLKRARLRLVSDELYQQALKAERDREWASWRGSSRFGTFQVCPMDVPAPWWHADPAVIPEGGTSHVRHGTARGHHTARRRSSGLAARGAGAAGGDADDWFSPLHGGGWLGGPCRCVSTGPERGRLDSLKARTSLSSIAGPMIRMTASQSSRQSWSGDSRS